MRKIFFLLLLLTGPLFFPACRVLEEQRIRHLLATQAEALQQGNAQAFLDTFSPEYQDPWLDLNQARARLQERFKERPLPLLKFEKQDIEVKSDRAVVTQTFSLEAQVNGKTRRYHEVQHLVFQRRPEGWRCAQGSKILRLLAGQMEEEEEIEQVLLRREAALINRDLESMMALISPHYHHRGYGPEELKQNVFQPVFQVYEEIKFRSYDRKLWFFGNTATVQQSFTMTANRVGTPVTVSGQERFELEKTEEGWKFTKGF